MEYNSASTPLILLLFAAVLLFASCGDFAGFQRYAEPDTGNLPRFDLYIGDDELNILYDSLTYERYAVCRFDDGTRVSPGEIRIRGFTSRATPKKSFTLQYENDNGDLVKVALDAGGDPWMSYNLAMYAYGLVGLPAPQLDPIALFLNNEYLGYYTVIDIYSENLQETYGEPGELFKVFLTDFARDYPIQNLSEKKFPDNDDFSRFNRLLANAANMASSDWVLWIEQNVHLEDVARYMAVRDFLGMADTYNTNFYVYIDEKSRILPWDNDHYYAYEQFGGDNLLTRRMLESPVFKALYNDTIDRHFIDTLSADYILDDLTNRKNELRNLLDTAVQNSPVFYLLYDDFIAEEAHITDFFANRPGTFTPIP
jgi:hypothetical protein